MRIREFNLQMPRDSVGMGLVLEGDTLGYSHIQPGLAATTLDESTFFLRFLDSMILY